MNEQILEQIRKIHALSERAGTEAEAANAAARVAELCRKHNIDIGVALLEREETSASEARDLESGVLEAHTVTLANACHLLFDVESYSAAGYEPVRENGTLVGQRRTSTRVFYGLKANVEAALITYQYLKASVEALLDGWVRTTPGPKGRSGYRAFRIGCARRIKAMAEQHVAGSKVLIPETEASTAIVRLGNSLIARYAKEKQLRKTHLAGVRGNGMTAYAAGYAAGSRVDLHGARSSRMLA
jgi:Protein of unknown function (DUF2786)